MPCFRIQGIPEKDQPKLLDGNHARLCEILGSILDKKDLHHRFRGKNYNAPDDHSRRTKLGISAFKKNDFLPHIKIYHIFISSYNKLASNTTL